MKRRKAIILYLLLTMTALHSKPVLAGKNGKPYSNRLATEKSPYLLQHAHNPVDWYPWGTEAFQKAVSQNKPVFLSIGYSTCHWCHVMEKETFSNTDIAKILNTHFVSIKVDREERPDIDALYMKAALSMGVNGGWPLNLFLTPDKKPFYAGTYFPPEDRYGSPGFPSVLLSIAGAWNKDKTEIMKSAEMITDHLKKYVVSGGDQFEEIDNEIFQKAFEDLERRYDPVYGGFGSSPKFPVPHQLQFLLRLWNRTKKEEALHMVERTLRQMSRGGIYDQIGGGFHRYSTDRKWHVPHFEKMLYDQALIAKAYLEAYQATGKKEYARTAKETLDYVLKELTGKEGGFYSAEDADSKPREDSLEKKEGAFYVWADEDIDRLLGKEKGAVFRFFYGLKSEGNVASDPHGEFGRKNILFQEHSLEETEKKFSLQEKPLLDILEQGREKLLVERNTRPRPHLDDKVLTDWNGLMISSLALAYRLLDEEKYKKASEKAAGFVLRYLRDKKGFLLHRYADGSADIQGMLDDYAFFVYGLIDLYEATFDLVYLNEAKDLTEKMVALFWDEEKGGFFLSSSHSPDLLYRQKEIYDGAVSSGNSVAAFALTKLARLTGRDDWEKKAKKIFQVFSGDIQDAPSGYASMLSSFDFLNNSFVEIAVSGDLNSRDTTELVEQIFERFIPSKVIAFSRDESSSQVIPFLEGKSSPDGKPVVYMCVDKACLLPVSRKEDLIEQLEKL